MKKFVSLCAFVAALSFVSCGGNTTSQAVDSTQMEAPACCKTDSAEACKSDSTESCCKGEEAPACDKAEEAPACCKSEEPAGC